MSRKRLHLRQLGGVTSRAGAAIGGVAHEIVRRVAVFARGAGVEILVVGGALVTRAAVAHPRTRLGARWVGVVTADAGADLALLRVVGVFVGVAARTGLIGATQYVVRRVTAGALAVTRRAPRAEHRQIFVAGPASDGLVAGELMRLVTSDAGNVTAFEQRGRGHDRLTLLVTRNAGGQRLRAGGVLLLVAGRANLVRRLALHCVRWFDVLVTVLARPRLGRRILVRPMTIETLASVVDLHGWRQRLANAMAMKTVARLVCVQLLMFRQVLQRLDDRVVAEPVTQRAVALQLHFQTSAGFGPAVRDAGLLLVAGGAA